MPTLPLDQVITLSIVSLAGLCLLLAIAVTVARGKYNVLAGSDEDPEHLLYQLIRAHGNQCEFVPILILLMWILGQTAQPAWVLWTVVVVTASRFLMAAGMVIPRTLAVPNPARFIGAMGTYIGGLALCFALVMTL